MGGGGGGGRWGKGRWTLVGEGGQHIGREMRWGRILTTNHHKHIQV